MLRFWLVLGLAAAAAGCTGSSYSVEGTTIDNANERAARYCGNRDATAQLEQVHQSGSNSVETYHCIASE